MCLTGSAQRSRPMLTGAVRTLGESMDVQTTPLRGHPPPGAATAVQRLPPSPLPPSLLSIRLDQTGLARQIFVLGKSKHSRGDLVVVPPGSSHEASQSERAAQLFSVGTKWLRPLLNARTMCSGLAALRAEVCIYLSEWNLKLLLHPRPEQPRALEK